jgi:hypothetical protein
MWHVHEQEEWPQLEQKTAFRSRRPQATHWLVPVVFGFFMAVRPSPAAGTAWAGGRSLPISGPRPVPPPI